MLTLSTPNTKMWEKQQQNLHISTYEHSLVLSQGSEVSSDSSSLPRCTPVEELAYRVSSLTQENICKRNMQTCVHVSRKQTKYKTNTKATSTLYAKSAGTQCTSGFTARTGAKRTIRPLTKFWVITNAGAGEPEAYTVITNGLVMVRILIADQWKHSNSIRMLFPCHKSYFVFPTLGLHVLEYPLY